jgi:pantetheine-phosphate adenylyltransferase
MKKVVFPGSFDPPTLGHLSIIERASLLFDEVHIALAEKPSTSKQTRWTIEQRRKMMDACIHHLKNIHVHQFSGLLVNFLQDNKISTIIRGVRSTKDWEFEMELFQVHKVLWPEVEMVCLAADQKYNTVSSSFVREILHYGGDVSKLVPESVLKLIRSF